jgi:putative PIN family toxin of toxin-antitoxin system
VRLVLDTNVVVSGLLWDGVPRRLLRVVRAEGVALYSSSPLLAELTDVLSRSKFKDKIAASLLTVDELVDLYAEFVALVRPVPTPRLAPDPDDDVVIGTALAAKAEYVVTGDKGCCRRMVTTVDGLLQSARHCNWLLRDRKIGKG